MKILNSVSSNTLENFKRVHNVNKKSDKLQEQVLQEELLHKIQENSNLHNQLEQSRADFQDKETKLIDAVCKLEMQIANLTSLKTASPNISTPENFIQSPDSKQVFIPFDAVQFNESLKFIFPSSKFCHYPLLKSSRGGQNSLFHPGVLIKIVTDNQESYKNLLPKIISRNEAILDFFNLRQRNSVKDERIWSLFKIVTIFSQNL